MIIELERYNESENYYKIGITGSQGHICYWMGPESICNYGSCPHGGGKRWRMWTGTGAHTLASKLGMRAGTHHNFAEHQRSISTHKMKIDWKEEGLGPSGPGLLARWPAQPRWLGGMWLHNHHLMATWPQVVPRVPKAMGLHSNHGFLDYNPGWRWEGPLGHGQV